MHKPLTNQNTAFLCERNYGKLSRLRADRIIYITFSLRPACRLFSALNNSVNFNPSKDCSV